MASILLTPPAVEPLSLAEAKAFLRVETADDDSLIAALIAAGRIHVERQAGLALITQGWRLVLDCWPENGRIALRPAPVKALIAARGDRRYLRPQCVPCLVGANDPARAVAGLHRRLQHEPALERADIH